MDGKTMLMNCPQEVKDIIIEKFGSLEYFYGYVYQLHANQFYIFNKTHKNDYSQTDRLKTYLEKVGIDFMVAGDLVEEIGTDFTEPIAINQAKSVFGDNWQKKMEEFDKLISQY